MGIDHQCVGGVELEFASSVPSGMRDVVEELFFFNPRQQALGPSIRRAIERFGTPEIFERQGRLWIGSARLPMQCLFAHDSKEHRERPIGVVLYSRLRPDTLTVTHVAADPSYCSGFGSGPFDLGVVLVGQVRRIAGKLNGVSRVELPYREGRFLSLRCRSFGSP